MNREFIEISKNLTKVIHRKNKFLASRKKITSKAFRGGLAHKIFFKKEI